MSSSPQITLSPPPSGLGYLHNEGTENWVVDRKYQWLLGLMLVLSYCWCVMPTGLQWQFFTVEMRSGTENVGPWFKVQWVPLFCIGAWVVMQRRALFLRLLPHMNPFLFALTAWAMLTALWAPDPALVVRQAVINIGILLMATAQVLASWQPDRLTTVLRWTLLGLCVASAIVALALPKVGVHQSDQFELKNSWRGVTMTKYMLGHCCQMSTLMWLHAGVTRRVKPMLSAIAVVFSVAVLLMTRSNTGLMVLVLGCVVMLLYVKPPLRLGELSAPAKLVTILSIVAVIFVYLVFIGSVTYKDVMTPIATMFGKDITLSGRTFIWAEVWTSITASLKNFLLGVGFMSFWQGPGSLADMAYLHIGWISPDGHNGYLDIWNEQGLIGLLLLVGFLVFHARQLGRIFAIDTDVYALHLAIFLMVCIENCMASGWFRPIAAAYVLAIYSSLTLSRHLLEQQLIAEADSDR